jgi:hypothetical protein
MGVQNSFPLGVPVSYSVGVSAYVLIRKLAQVGDKSGSPESNRHQVAHCHTPTKKAN